MFAHTVKCLCTAQIPRLQFHLVSFPLTSCFQRAFWNRSYLICSKHLVLSSGHAFTPCSPSTLHSRPAQPSAGCPAGLPFLSNCCKQQIGEKSIPWFSLCTAHSVPLSRAQQVHPDRTNWRWCLALPARTVRGRSRARLPVWSRWD